MILNENNKKYTIHLCDTLKNSMFMIKWIENYLTLKEKRIIGIDFEFNRINNVRKIALCQINMEVEEEHDAYIFIFYPPDITKLSNVFKRLLIDPTIIKILHGGESLDIPYLFTDILIDQPDREKFCVNLFDTKYMCEYFNISNQLINNRCRIYDLLLQMKVITQQKLNELETNDKKMGNIWEINLKINKLSTMAIIYCLYDVLYLPALFNTFPKEDVYLKLLPEISCYNNITRFDMSLSSLYNMISQYNTMQYTMKSTSDSKISYNEIYSIVYIWLGFNKKFNNLFQINYFKKFYEILVKNIIYSRLSTKYTDLVYPTIMNSIMKNYILSQFYSDLLEYIIVVM
jgi:hypothetical protein